MSGKKVKSRSSSGILSGVVIVSTGLIAGYYGLEMSMASADNGTEAAQALHGLNKRTKSMNDLVTAAINQNIPAEKNTVFRNGIEFASAPVKNEVELPERPVSKPANKTVSVNRAQKNDRVIFLSPEDAALIEQEAVREQSQQVASNDQPQLDRGGMAALAGVASDYNTEEPAVVETAQPAPAPAAPVAAPKPAAVAVAAPKVAAKPQQKAARIDGPELPYADSADMALFAADMPLPTKLTNYRQVASDAPLSARATAVSQPLAKSALIPRKFSTGKAFGGLSENEFQKRERRCMTTALYFEARSEPEAGQIAVGQVIMNRVRSPDYPDTICGVVYQGSHRRTGCQFSFTCDGKADRPSSKSQWERSKQLADKVLEGQIWMNDIGHSTHYHATYVHPVWRKKMARIKKIGRHIFYKSPNISVTNTYQAVRASRS